MTQTPLVLVVDDEPIIRTAIDNLLRSVGYRVRCFAATADLCDDPAGLQEADCLILDVRLPFTSGLDFQQTLVAMGVDIPVVFVTGHGDIPMSVRAMKAGAADFLSKPYRDQDMLDAVACACRRRAATRNDIRLDEELRARFSSLTARERQVMELVTSGLMNKQIAGHLALSEITVKVHRGKIMRKMQARTFADLVKMNEALTRLNATPAAG
ncbi:response regulator transcription factor [Rhizobium sp. SSA_523]|uniref:response regulator transcription factor n=1 Tax=Rhizobium sp. SSA_523 TaxID=2952477 RepID=UPI0020906780|nr:response regulator [Rhizobium sp. SSA_523]MCO5734216.1 response regulator [Rhizobium sp. SSA_523]WKC21505.1 response regulator [Rhizobium sp. SSA_523]